MASAVDLTTTHPADLWRSGDGGPVRDALMQLNGYMVVTTTQYSVLSCYDVTWWVPPLPPNVLSVHVCSRSHVCMANHLHMCIIVCPFFM